MVSHRALAASLLTVMICFLVGGVPVLAQTAVQVSPEAGAAAARALRQGPHRLAQSADPIRVLEVVHPAFPALDPATRREAIKDLEGFMKRFFGVSVRVEDRGSVPLRPFMERHGIAVAGRAAVAASVLPAPGPARKSYLASLARSLAEVPPANVRRYLPPESQSRSDLATAVLELYETRARAVLASPPGVQGAGAAELGWITMEPWARLLKAQKEAEILIINVPLVYRYTDGTALHALVRGGLVGGFTTFGRPGRHDGAAVATLHALVSDHPVVGAVGGGRARGAPLARTLAAVMAHELGHLMFRLPDDYGHDRCLMHPPPGLDYNGFWFGLSPIATCAPCGLKVRAFRLRRDIDARAKAGDGPGTQAGYRALLAQAAVQVSPEAGAAAARALRQGPLQLTQGSEDAQSLNAAAWTCVELGRADDEVLGWARRAVALSPGSGAIQDTLGWVLVRRGDFYGALHVLEKAASTGDPEILAHRAWARLGAGFLRGAIEDLGRVAVARGALGAFQRAHPELDLMRLVPPGLPGMDSWLLNHLH